MELGRAAGREAPRRLDIDGHAMQGRATCSCRPGGDRLGPQLVVEVALSCWANADIDV